MIDIGILNELNAPTREERLNNLRRTAEKSVFPPLEPRYINNHIHTFYSFSPYSPAAAVYAARAEGLCTAGIIDHDSIAGAGEFIEAGRILDMPLVWNSAYPWREPPSRAGAPTILIRPA